MKDNAVKLEVILRAARQRLRINNNNNSKCRMINHDPHDFLSFVILQEY